MLKKLTRGVCSVIGLVSGYAIAESLIEIPQIADLSYFSNSIYRISFIIAVSIVFGIIGIGLNVLVNRDCWQIVRRYILKRD